MTAQPIEPPAPGLWSPDPVWRIERNPVHVYAYELVGDRYELVADSAEELIVAKPFEIRLRVRDITP